MVKRKSITGARKRKKAVEIPATSTRRQDAPACTSPKVPPMSTIPNPATPSPVNRKRKRDEAEVSAIESRTSFAALRPRLRHIDQEVIKTKWRILPEPVQERVRDLLKSIERPVINTQREERRRIEAQVAVGCLVRTLGKRLPRMPFPPNTKEVQFNYEALLEGNRELERQLTPAQHSIALLSDKLNKEVHVLRATKAELVDLETNAKGAVGLRKRQKAHRLLDSTQGVDALEDMPDQIGLKIPRIGKPSLSELQSHLAPSLEPLIFQLQSHLDSMENNAMQVTGIRHAISQSSATLEDRKFHQNASPISGSIQSTKEHGKIYMELLK